MEQKLVKQAKITAPMLSSIVYFSVGKELHNRKRQTKGSGSGKGFGLLLVYG
jgi:hypothetical protein